MCIVLPDQKGKVMLDAGCWMLTGGALRMGELGLGLGERQIRSHSLLNFCSWKDRDNGRT